MDLDSNAKGAFPMFPPSLPHPELPEMEGSGDQVWLSAGSDQTRTSAPFYGVNLVSPPQSALPRPRSLKMKRVTGITSDF